jgi:uncharacterized protein with ATP-grasp and redox domains
VKSWHREIDTHLSLVRRFVDLADLPPGEAAIIKSELERYMQVRLNRGHWVPPEVTRFHTEWYREFYRIVGVADPYLELKRRSNALVQQILARLDLPTFRRAVLAAVTANRLDFGAPEALADTGKRKRETVTRNGEDDGEIPLHAGHFDRIDGLPLYWDDFQGLESQVLLARRLLYLPDNCGEVLFDRVVIEHIRKLNPGCRITLAAKDGPMLNDVTCSEALALGLGDICEVISTGSNCFGAPEDEVSQEFKNALSRSDLIIAKGQAYLEFWIEYDLPRVFHLAYTKFPVLDPILGRVPEGVNVILSSARYASGKRLYQF